MLAPHGTEHSRWVKKDIGIRDEHPGYLPSSSESFFFCKSSMCLMNRSVIFWTSSSPFFSSSSEIFESFSNFFKRDRPRCRDRFRHDARVSGFAALSAKRNGRQIWAIGFDHKFPKRDLCRDFSHGCAVFESNNSSERNEVIKTENFIRLIERAAEAMKHAAQFAGIWLHNFQRVLPGVALMNHCVEPQFQSKVELLLK